MSEYKDACFKSLEERLRYLAQVAKTDVMRGSLAAAADRIESDEAKIDQMESDMSKMNGGRSCKVCGQDYIVAEIGERMGFRIDVALLENRRQAKEIAEWEVLTSENVARIEELHDTIKKQEAKIEDSKRAAESLALSLWRRYYKDISPNFELCDSTSAVISQIHNMAEGFLEEMARLRAVVGRLGSGPDVFPHNYPIKDYSIYTDMEMKARMRYARDNLNPPEK